MDFRFRPLPTWPYPPTRQRRSRYTFKAPWSDTLYLLDRELSNLHARELVIGAGFRETDLRLDGLPRANAQRPQHPGIEISFTVPDPARSVNETRQWIRLVYATDVCELWEHNVRSIALGLEALRAVDRYGITRRGEQYAGWRQLEATTSASAPSIDRGRALIAEHGSVRNAQRATHPDVGGDRIDFESVQLAAEADA